MIPVACPHCDKKYNIKDAFSGKKVRCKVCAKSFLVPELPDDREYSPSGTEIIRHEAAQAREPEMAFGDEKLIHAISDHVSKHLGPTPMVFHELVSELVHLDVYHVKPAGERQCHTLVTCGMSERPMKTPQGLKGLSHAELLIHLPQNWPMKHEDWDDENNYWPVRWLKMLARLPHEYDTWLGHGHTVPNGDPAQPFADNTDFCCWLLLEPMLVPERFTPLKMKGRKIHFYQAVPLYAEEMDFKLARGLEALLKRFDRINLSPILDVKRRNACEPK